MKYVLCFMAQFANWHYLNLFTLWKGGVLIASFIDLKIYEIRMNMVMLNFYEVKIYKN